MDECAGGQREMTSAAGLTSRHRVLSRIAMGDPLDEILQEIVRAIELEVLGAPLAISLVDPDAKVLRKGAFSSVLAAFAEACDGLEIGPASGACGTAVFRRESVLVSDIATDPLFVSFRDLVLPLGLRACLSVPIIAGAGGEALGAFAVYGATREVVVEAADVVESAAQLAGIAIVSARTLNRLRDSEARFRAYVDHAADAVYIQGPACRIEDANEAACAMLGYTREELIGMQPSAFDHDLSAEGSDDIQRRLKRGETVALETFHVRKDGVRVPVEIRMRQIDDAGKQLSIVRDMTVRAEAERDLRRAQELVHLGNWSYELATETWNASPEFWRICGFPSGPRAASELLARVHPDDRERVVEVTRATIRGEACKLEHRLVVDGVTKWLDVRTDPGVRVGERVERITGTSQDITERRRLEDQLRQKLKLEAIGRLAGGVAHDFNNMLTVINSLSEELSEDPSIAPEKRDDIRAIHEAGRRATSLTAQLLAFSRRTIVELTSIDVNSAIEGLSVMLHRLIGEDVRLTRRLDAEIPAIEGDRGQIDQLLINLVLNARDAMPGGGEVTITTERALIDGGEALAADLLPGVYVRLVVSDTGTGMSEEVKARLFEPFFTTKGAGRGTGLGLATVYGIVQQLRGQVSVKSSLGQGTTFTIVLPARGSQRAPKRSDKPAFASPEAEGTILVVEDEPSVRTLVCRMLRKLGYEVIEARTGVEALALVEARSGPIDLLLSDVVMPEMGGRELSERIRALRPAIKVLFMSGYTDDEVLRQGVSVAERAFIQKPFGSAILYEKVRSLLHDDSLVPGRVAH